MVEKSADRHGAWPEALDYLPSQASGGPGTGYGGPRNRQRITTGRPSKMQRTWAFAGHSKETGAEEQSDAGLEKGTVGVLATGRGPPLLLGFSK